MRCGCPECGAFMIHAEKSEACVCPECGHRCQACLGTDSVVSREGLAQLARVPWIAGDIREAEASLRAREEEP